MKQPTLPALYLECSCRVNISGLSRQLEQTLRVGAQEMVQEAGP